jgi:hemoglobin-like flavoprotein
LYSIWSDEKIGAGEQWEGEIEANIASARIALLLVTPDFVESPYIGSKELPAILDRNKKKGLVLQWVPVKSVSDAKLDLIKVKPFQSLWPLDQPLAKLPEEEQQDAIETIAGKVIMSLGLSAEVNSQTMDGLETDLKAALGPTIVLGERIAFGDGSLVYKATQEDEEIAVKVALPSMRRPWVAADFVTRAKAFRNIIEPLFIRIRNAQSDARVSWVTMDNVALPSLKNVMTQSEPPGLPPEVVAEVLAKVTLAASNLHQETMSPDKGPLLVGPLRSGHIYRNADTGKIKISPIQMSQATLQTSQARPLSILAEDELTWLAPEQYEGQRAQVATDQYYIGLLGLELLTGKEPVKVNCYADLNKKRLFFAAPMAGFSEKRKASPALFFVLARMLERRPEDRWPTMADAHRAMRQVAEGSLPDDLRSKAREVYRKLWASSFYRDLYEEMFRISGETRAFFKQTNMEEQQKKLHAAAGMLLNFRPSDDPNPMSPHASSHRELGLRPEHFTAFRDAFLVALSKQKPKPDSYAVDAWRAILDAGIAYMTVDERRGARAAGRRRPKSSGRPAIRLVRSG